MTVTTATSECGTIRRRRTEIMPGKISRLEIRFSSWTRTLSITRARIGISALLPSTASAVSQTHAGKTSGTISDISCAMHANSTWPTSLPTARSVRQRYCLAQTPAVGAEYLAYAPAGGSFTMDLSAMASSRKLTVEWFNPASGETISQDSITAGSSSRSFSAPFTGDAVLYLVDTEGHK